MAGRRFASVDSGAWIEGEPAPLEHVVSVAASLLSGSRQPLLTGMGTDIEGARAAVTLAEQIGGVIDHMHSTAILRDLDPMRETGVMLTTPVEAHVRADTVLLVGDQLLESWPQLAARILGSPLRRRVIWLAPADDAKLSVYEVRYEVETTRLVIGSGAKRAAALASLRARAKGRPVAGPSIPLGQIDAVAESLRAARFGVAIWSAAALDALEIETINGLVRDLNEMTRFSTLPLAPADNGAGVLAACGWMTGFPMRTGFGAGMPEHDPWRFDTGRLVAEGETDCVMWISALGASWPAWGEAPAIALCDAATRFAREPKARITVGRPGVNHDAVLHNPDIGSLVATPASAPSEAPSVAQVLALIAARLAGQRAAA